MTDNAAHVSIDDNIMNTLRANPELRLTDEFGEVMIAGTGMHFPLTESRAAIKRLEAQGLIGLVKDFARTRVWAITKAGKRPPLQPQPAQSVTLNVAQVQIITHAQQTGAPFTLSSLYAAGVQRSTTDIAALLAAGLIELVSVKGEHESWALTPAGKTYAPPEPTPSPAFQLARAVGRQVIEWRQQANDLRAQPLLLQKWQLIEEKAALLEACADDLDRILSGEAL